MKIVIIGAGSVGMLTAYYLQKNGLQPTLLTNRKEQATMIDENGLSITYNQQEFERIHIQSLPFSSISKLGDIDLAILAVKSHQVKHVIDDINHLSIQAMIFLQNGMSHIELFPELNVPEISAAIIEHGALKLNDHTVYHTGIGQLRWGYVKKGEQHIQSLFSTWDEPLFQAVYEKDWLTMLKKKLVINTCLNPLSAILKIKNGELVENEYVHKMARAIFEEVMSVLEMDEKEKMWEQVIHVCQITGKNHSSMLVDVENHRPTEVDSMIGYLLKHSKQRPTPILQFLYDAIKSKEVMIGEEGSS